MVKVNSPIASRLIGVALLASFFTSSCRGGPSATGQALPPANVQLQEVKTSTVQESSEFVGALEARTRVALQPEAAGRVVRIYVSSGDSVEAGTPIMQLKAVQNRAQVSGARADVEAAIAARNTAQATVKSTEAERARAVADVELQKAEFQRTQSLVNAGAQSQQSLDQAKNRRDTAVASLRAAEEQVGAARASLNEAQARASRAQADQAVATANLQDSRVLAPIAGVVGDIPTKVGAYVTTSDTLTSIIQNRTLDLDIAIPIERSSQLRIGLPVELLSADNKPLTRGRISFVSPGVNDNTQSILAKASFSNEGSLRDGQFVRARVVWESSPGLLVPTTAVTRIAGEPFVFITEQAKASQAGQPQQVARQRPVELGNEIQGNSYPVISGIKEGEKVIVSGVVDLKDGAPVNVEQAASGEPPTQAN